MSSAFDLHRHGGAVICFWRLDREDAVAVAGSKSVAVERMGEAKAAAPVAVAKLAEQGVVGRFFGLIGCIGLRVQTLSADAETAIAGFHVDAVVSHAGEFQANGVVIFGFVNLWRVVFELLIPIRF